MTFKRNINGKLALGYGSKYNLLRMLGWHRNELNTIVGDAIECNPDHIKWLDFGYSGQFDDKEPMNFSFINQDFNNEWLEYWQGGSRNDTGLNWDAIGKCDDTYILIEAKAHIEELDDKTGCGASQPARSIIEKRVKEFLAEHNIPFNKEHLGLDYQLMNRLVALSYLHKKGIKAELVYLLFVNGFENNRDKPKCASKEKLEEKMNTKLSRVGLTNAGLDNMVKVIYINAKKEK